MDVQHSGEIWRDFPELVPGVVFAGALPRSAAATAPPLEPGQREATGHNASSAKHPSSHVAPDLRYRGPYSVVSAEVWKAQ